MRSIIASVKQLCFHSHVRLHSSCTHLLVIDGYTKESRQQLLSGGASTGGELYKTMLSLCSTTPHCIDIMYPSDTDFNLPDLKKYDGIAWTGCSQTVFSKEAVVRTQINIAKQIFALGIPSFGSCWGMQVAIMASGGMCAANFRGREMGVSRKITLSGAGQSHPMFEGKPATFDAFTSHKDEVTHLPHGAIGLAGNHFTSVQALAVTHQRGTFWGVQYHPEYNLHELAMLMNCRIPRLLTDGFFSSVEAAGEYIEDLLCLSNNPSRTDIAWRLGLDCDVLDDNVRTVEVRNWLKYQVYPFQERKEFGLRHFSHSEISSEVVEK